MNLTEHFTLEELVASSTAQRLGIDNAPSPEIAVLDNRGMKKIEVLYQRGRAA